MSRLAETIANKRAAGVHVDSPATRQRPISYAVGPQRVLYNDTALAVLTNLHDFFFK
jgi:hypothetical protein